MFVIKRTDKKGGYVAQPGSHNSYTFSAEKVRLFDTEEEAEKDRCPKNEVVLPASECFRTIY